MGRKAFLSFLGATNYFYCDYRHGGQSYGEVRFIQEATLKLLGAGAAWGPNDVALIFVTKDAKDKNWRDDGQKDRDSGLPVPDKKTGGTLEGLQTRLQKSFPKLAVKTVDVPDGNDEGEIWAIFERVFTELGDGDELYVDLTHGFRYLPMLMLILCNYARFLKRTAIKSITYGNYEASRQLGYAPIVDLLPLSDLQDWTHAAGTYLETGNVDKLVETCHQEVAPILRETRGQDAGARLLKEFANNLRNVVQERQTCRGMAIIESTSFQSLQEKTDAIAGGTFVAAFNPIIEEIKKSFAGFVPSRDVRNGYAAAQWCFANKLYQQAATILQEAVVSFFCERHGIRIDDEKTRGDVNKAFQQRFLQNGGNLKRPIEACNPEKFAELLGDALFDDKNIIDGFARLKEARNDYNHSGMRSNPCPAAPDRMIANIKGCLDAFAPLFAKG